MHITIENLTINVDNPMTALSEAPRPAENTAPASLPAVGAVWPGQGGVYAGIIHCEGTDYHLIVSQAAEHSGLAWGGYGSEVDGASHDCDGQANTADLMADDTDHPAARWAAEVNADGHADFYLPSRRELRLCWVNVPELFDKKTWYWTSTQYSAHFAWFQNFGDGGQGDDGKHYEGRARAVRRFKVNP